MWIVLIIGSVTTVVNLGIQVLVIIVILRYLLKRLQLTGGKVTFQDELVTLASVLVGLFAGHLLQFATWALLFLFLGEFADFNTAFYHSAVNFASLGYGDIVMGERWRLLGALEATNGVLMLGLSAGSILSVMNAILSRRQEFSRIRNLARNPGEDSRTLR